MAVQDFYPTGIENATSSELDALFGPSATPIRVEITERFRQPESLTTLNESSAPIIKSYLKAASDGLKIAQVSHQLLPILWVMDENAQIHMALEEVVEIATQNTSFPLARRFQVPDGFEKLGHPSLIYDASKGGRIGGELLYDPDPEFGVENWVITNASGRYGRNCKQEHLANVAEVFACYGIRFSFYFL